MLPLPEHTTFLLAAIGETQAAGAWQRWTATAASTGRSPRQALATHKELLALLSWNLSRHGIPVDPEIATYLQFARLTEKLRVAKFHDVCGEVFDLLHDTATPYLVLKGAALGAHVYPSPGLRHAHDLELLVHPEHISAAWSRVVSRGWSAAPRRWPARRHLPMLTHASGLPLRLHRHLLVPFCPFDFGDLWARRQSVTMGGRNVAMLSDADALIHACVHGVGAGPHLRWVPDAWFLMTRGRGLDWDALAERTMAARLSIPVGAALAYFNTAIADVVPATVLRRLEAPAYSIVNLVRYAARGYRGLLRPQGRAID